MTARRAFLQVCLTYLDTRACPSQQPQPRQLVLPRRWVVERTFGWMTRWRRLVRDYEQRIDVSYAMILVAMGGNLLRRNTHP